MAENERVDEIVADLERLSEALVDLAMDSLREALDEGASAAAEATKQEKVINRARSSLEKAARLLRSLPGGAAEDASEADGP